VAPAHERLRRFPSSAIIGITPTVRVEAALEVIIVLVVIILFLARSDSTLEVATRIILTLGNPAPRAVQAGAGIFLFLELIGVKAGDLFASFVPNEGGSAAGHLSDGLSRFKASICSLGVAHAGDGVATKVDSVSIHKITS
jgi:hypothetical protein